LFIGEALSLPAFKVDLKIYFYLELMHVNVSYYFCTALELNPLVLQNQEYFLISCITLTGER